MSYSSVIDHAPLADRRSDQGPDRDLLDVGQHPDHDLAGPLDHAENRRLLLGQSAPASVSFQSPASAGSAFFLTTSGLPLCPATT